MPFFPKLVNNKKLLVVYAIISPSMVSEETWGKCFKLLTTVIYYHSMVIPSFCVLKIYYLGNYCGMAVNYHGRRFYYIGPW
jgi:hypothetical protein